MGNNPNQNGMVRKAESASGRHQRWVFSNTTNLCPSENNGCTKHTTAPWTSPLVSGYRHLATLLHDEWATVLIISIFCPDASRRTEP